MSREGAGAGVPQEYGRRIPPGDWHLPHFVETSQKCVVEYLSEAGGFLLGRNLRKLRRLLAECHSTPTPLSTSSLRAPRAGGRQLDDAVLLGERGVVIDRETGPFGVRGHSAIDIRDRTHKTSSFRSILERPLSRLRGGRTRAFLPVAARGRRGSDRVRTRIRTGRRTSPASCLRRG